LKKLLLLLVLLPVNLTLLSCYSAPSGSSQTAGIKYRAFVSDSVSAGTSSAGVYIVDAQNDIHPGGLAPIAAGNTPGMMVVTPNRAQTLVFSGNNLLSSDNTFNIINNAAEFNAARLTLPGYTESFVVSPDSSTAYVAVPSAPVVGQSPGAMEVVGLGAGAFAGEVDIPSVHYLSMNNGGDRILAFSDVLASLGPSCNQNPSFLFVVTPSQVGVTPCPAVPVPGINYPFDHPVAAFFSSDDTVAYVVNCGAECGGVQASVQKLEMTPTQCLPDGVCAAVPVPASTVALVDGSTMYLAGTPYSGGNPSQPCTGQQTAATTCGLLTIFDLNSMTVTNTSPIVITDGYHNRIAMGANGQLFIGARTCTEIIPPQPPPPGAEVRGCLSIYNTQNVAVGSIQPGAVTIPPETGDVTGIQPIATRDVVYLVQGQNVQGGTLYIYDTTTDAVDATEEKKINNLVGDFVDVKTVDF
jgi:hypothetical protein